MPEINLVFELQEGKATDEVARSLQDRLAALEGVGEVEATPESADQVRMTGLEIAAAIGVTVLVVRGGRELVEELRKLLQEVKGLVAESRELKNVFVELGRKRVPLAEVKPEELARLAEGG